MAELIIHGGRCLTGTISVGGNKKAHAKGESDSRTGDKQNAGHGGHK